MDDSVPFPLTKNQSTSSIPTRPRNLSITTSPVISVTPHRYRFGEAVNRTSWWQEQSLDIHSQIANTYICSSRFWCIDILCIVVHICVIYLVINIQIEKVPPLEQSGQYLHVYCGSVLLIS